MSIRALAAPAWALLALFVIYASTGTRAAPGARVWAPTMLSWPDVAQNILLYVPVGIFGVLTLRRQRRASFAPAVLVVAIAAVFSALVEAMQLYTSDRIGSVIDVIAAVTGTALGVLAATPASRAAGQVHRSLAPSGLFKSESAPVLWALLAALCVTAWWPFDPTLDVSSLAGRLRALQRDPWQFEPLPALVQALLYLLLTLTLAVCTDRLRTAEAALKSGMLAALAAVLLDAGQLAMGAQPIGLAGLAAQFAGATAGAALFAIGCVPK